MCPSCLETTSSPKRTNGISGSAVIPILLLTLLWHSCGSSVSQDNSNASQTNTGARTTETGNHLKMKLAAITDNKVTKGNAIIFLLPENWNYKSTIDWDFSNTVFPANGAVEVNEPNGSASFHDYKTQYYTVATATMYQTGFVPGKRYIGQLIMATMPNSTTEAAQNTCRELNVIPAGFKVIETKVINIPVTGEANINAVRNNPQLKFIAEKIIQKGTFTKNDENYTCIISSSVNATVGVGYSSWYVRPTVFIIKQNESEKVNTELLTTIYSSFRVTPAFEQVNSQVVKLLSDRFYQGVRDAAAMSASISRNNDLMIQSIEQSYQQANRSNSSSSDKSNEDFSSYIRGTENYSDGNGSSYELPNTYNTAWRNSSGEIILSKDAGYDPNADASAGTLNWEKLKK